MGKNVQAVQTPGATADQSDQGAGQDHADTATPAKATKTMPKATPAESRVTNRPSRSQYAQMHSSEVDASTLTSAVLCTDGWVCPPTVGPANPK